MANFSLVDLLKRQLLGQAAMMQPGQGMGGATQGLLGQGGNFGGGLLQSNLSQMNQGEGGLLGNIPQAAILGSALYGQGMQGKDPFSGLLPAVSQTAQIQKMLTPKKTELQKNLEAAGYEVGSPEYKAALGAYLNKGKENTLSKEALALFQQGQAAGKNFDQWYGNLNKADKYLFDNKIKPNMDFLQQVAQFKSDENQDMSIPKGNIPPLKDWLVIAQEQNPDVSEKDLIEFYNKKYGK
jgi:hypothetical protein